MWSRGAEDWRGNRSRLHRWQSCKSSFQNFLQFLPCHPHPFIPEQGEEVSSKLQLQGNTALGAAGTAQPLLPLPKNKTPSACREAYFSNEGSSDPDSTPWGSALPTTFRAESLLVCCPQSRAGSQAHQTAPVKRRARLGRSLCKMRAPKAGRGGWEPISIDSLGL